MQADFGHLSNEQRDFVAVLKSYVIQLNSAELQRRVTANDGTLNVRLDGHDVALVRGTHFFYNKKDKNSF